MSRHGHEGGETAAPARRATAVPALAAEAVLVPSGCTGDPDPGKGGGPASPAEKSAEGGEKDEGSAAEKSPTGEKTPPAPPVASADDGSRSAESVAGNNGPAHFSAGQGGGVTTTFAEFTKAARDGDAVAFEPVAGLDGAPVHARLGGDYFFVRSGGDELTAPTEFSYDPGPSARFGATETFTLTIPNAPAKGLLGYLDSEPGAGGPIPSVAVCYDTESTVFSTEYERCT